MKNKIKNSIFVISIAFVLAFLSIEIFNLVTYDDKVYLEDKESNLERLSEYKVKVSELEDSSCKTELEKFIKRYENSSYKGYVSLKDIYNFLESDTFVSYYQDFRNNCEITEEETKNHELVYNILDSMVTYEELFSDKRFPYEIRLYDRLTRDIVEPSLNVYRYDKIKRSELSFIKNVLDLLEEREENNEK